MRQLANGLLRYPWRRNVDYITVKRRISANRRAYEPQNVIRVHTRRPFGATRTTRCADELAEALAADNSRTLGPYPSPED